MLYITTKMLAASYEFFRTTPPFRCMDMPHSETVHFRVLKSRDRGGHYRGLTITKPGKWTKPEIAISRNGVHDYRQLQEAVAHEMIHYYIDCARLERKAHHCKNFKRIALRVCKYHKFDPDSFDIGAIPIGGKNQRV